MSNTLLTMEGSRKGNRKERPALRNTGAMFTRGALTGYSPVSTNYLCKDEGMLKGDQAGFCDSDLERLPQIVDGKPGFSEIILPYEVSIAGYNTRLIFILVGRNVCCMKPLDQNESPKLSEKKPYSKPILQVYGDLRTITHHVGNVGMTRDSAPHMGNSKTR